jgi:DNA polymerase-3 subunit alpha
MKDLCKRIEPDCLDDITAINALYRPGPLGSGMVDDFIERKHGRKEITYPFAELEPVLKDTYGVVVYQEQVMNVSRIIAGYSLGQADMLRRAMGKKKIAEMDRHKEIFKQGATEKEFDVKKAEDLFDLMAKFAEYGFNKSHAVAYAYIAYQTAYLKKYYLGPFYAALLSTEMGNTDKVTNYISDAKENGLVILPPDINESLWAFNIIGSDRIRFGMGAVKNVGHGAVEEIIRERKENGPFEGFIDFCERIQHNQVNKRVIESLIKVGAFDQCEQFNRKTLLENMEKIIQFAQKKQEEKEIGQGNLFEISEDIMNEQTSEVQLDLHEVEGFEFKEKLAYEAALMGIYVSGHPLDRVAGIIKDIISMPIREAHQIDGQDKREMVMAGIFASHKAFISKKGDRMAFATLEDLSGKMECIVFPRVYGEYGHLLESDEPVVIQGVVNLAEDPRKLFPQKITLLKDHADQQVSGIRIQLDLNDINEKKLYELQKMMLSHRGSVPTHIIFDHEFGRARLPLGEEYLLSANPQIASQINQLFNKNAVSFIINGRLTQSMQAQ